MKLTNSKPNYKATSTAELIQNKQLADFKIKCLILKYPDSVCKMARDWDYNTEVEYIVMSVARNEFIKNLALSLEGNSLILFQFVEKHGRDLHSIIKEQTKNRQVFFVYGGTDVEVRESIRAITEKEKDAIIVASYGTFSTGDDFRIGKFTNYTLKHFVERVKIYDDEKFNYKFYNIDLKNG